MNGLCVVSLHPEIPLSPSWNAALARAPRDLGPVELLDHRQGNLVERLLQRPLPFTLIFLDPKSDITGGWLDGAWQHLRRGVDLVVPDPWAAASRVRLRPAQLGSEMRRRNREIRWRTWFPRTRRAEVWIARGIVVQKLKAGASSLDAWSYLIRDPALTQVSLPCSVDRTQELLLSRHRLTGDDWGLSPAINEAMLALAQQGSLRRVSILVDGSFTRHRLDELRAVPGVEFSLHFNLTWRQPHSGPRSLLWSGLTRRLKRQWVIAEFERQSQAFNDLGLSMVRVDGHHHCHIFPGVFEPLLPLWKNLGVSVRLPEDWGTFRVDRWVINLLARRARRRLIHAGVRHEGFWYPSLSDLRKPARWDRRLRRSGPTEVLIHPATRVDFDEHGVDDPYTLGRVQEYEALVRPTHPAQ